MLSVGTLSRNLGILQEAMDGDQQAREQEGFIERLSELAEGLGGKAALARRAGVPPSSLDSYFGGTEPSRRVLNRLAEAGRVSLDWLSRGIGQKDSDAAPEGYLAVIYFDLRYSGPHMRAIDFTTRRRLLIRRDDLRGIVISGSVFLIGGAEEGLDFPPLVHGGDTLLIEVRRDHRFDRPTMTDAWPIEEDAIHLMAEGAELRLRRLRRNKDNSISVITADGKVESKLTGAPRNTILYGQAIWRSGLLK